MIFDLKGKTAVVTGGSRGIGKALATGLADHGANVVIVVQSTLDLAQSVAESIEAKGGRAKAIQADVTKPDEIERAAAEAAAAFGAVDILVNNAGIVRVGRAEEYDHDDWRDTMAVNLDGVFYASQAFGRLMIDQGHGSIINIGSMSGRIVNWPFRHAAYNASKAAVHMLTKCLATEWAEFGIRVNAIAPGYIRTELTDEVIKSDPEAVEQYWKAGAVQGRIGEVDELIGVTVYLASDASSFTTGEVITVDGGLTLR